MDIADAEQALVDIGVDPRDEDLQTRVPWEAVPRPARMEREHGASAVPGRPPGHSRPPEPPGQRPPRPPNAHRLDHAGGWNRGRRGAPLIAPGPRRSKTLTSAGPSPAGSGAAPPRTSCWSPARPSSACLTPPRRPDHLERSTGLPAPERRSSCHERRRTSGGPDYHRGPAAGGPREPETPMQPVIWLTATDPAASQRA